MVELKVTKETFEACAKLANALGSSPLRILDSALVFIEDPKDKKRVKQEFLEIWYSCKHEWSFQFPYVLRRELS